MRKEVDFLVIGSGIAGLTYALKVAEYGRVMIITKADAEESNTKYAQGGIAAVMTAEDTVEKHIQDTLISGDGLCDERIVRMVIEEGNPRIQELIAWGANFDKKPSGEFDLAKEGGHSEFRVLHHKDNTGQEIERALLDQIHAHPSIDLHTHYFAIDLITQHHLGQEVTKATPGVECYGVYALNTENGEIDTILSKLTLVATGGAGHVYQTTTNPVIATGDGIAMVYRAKGRVENMEFIQFHPTALYNPYENPSFLISEAVRGAGGLLRNKSGKEFMYKYDPRGSLATRDIAARAIDSQLKKYGDEFVYLDCTSISKETLLAHFPNIYAKCLSLGINIVKDYIPVAPAAHFMCGGIKVNENGQSSISNLYAAGECASTGLHGANRLASNSLLEAVVYAHRASISATQQLPVVKLNHNVPDWNAEGMKEPEEMVVITHNLKELQAVMSNYVGIVRNDKRLKGALERLKIIYLETETLYQKSILSPKLCELRNLITIGYIIVKQALERKESRGLHYNTDHPTKVFS